MLEELASLVQLRRKTEESETHFEFVMDDNRHQIMYEREASLFITNDITWVAKHRAICTGHYEVFHFHKDTRVREGARDRLPVKACRTVLAGSP